MKRSGGLVLALVIALPLAAGCRGGEHEEHREHGEHGEHSGDHSKTAPGKPAPGKTADHDDHDHDDHAENNPAADPAAHTDPPTLIRLTPTAIERSGIRVEPALAGRLPIAVEIPAEVQFDPDRVAHVTPLVDGQLITVEATLGDRVEADQPLATLRSVALGQARAELARAEAMVDIARQDANRQTKLRAAGINAERTVLESRLTLRAAQAERDAARSRLTVFGIQAGKGSDMVLGAPLAGVVLERHATRGENVGPTDTLFVIGDVTTVRVIGRVPAAQIARLRPGMGAILTLPAWPGRRFEGQVDFIAAALDERTRTLPVRVELPNPDGALRPGLYGTLYLDGDAPDGPPVPLLPIAALQTLAGRPVVFAPGDESGTFTPLFVIIGRSEAGRVEILAGLDPGRPVVVDGAFILKSEAMRGELGHGHAH